MQKIRVGLYPRVSSHEQTEGYSIGEQIERLTKYSEAMEWEVYKIYTDPGYSGGDTNRPGLQEMLKDVKVGKIDKVVVYKLDRLSRSQKDTMMLIEDEFLANGVDFVSMSENFDTATPFGRAMIGILAVFAQLERENIKERTMIGKEARAKEGKWHGGSTEPIGYDYDPATELLNINDYEALQIRELYSEFLKGTPLRTIETNFINKGYKHKYGNWSPKAMREVMSNKLYIGYLRHRGEWVKGLQDSIIDEETYEKAVKLLKSRQEAFKETGLRPGAQTTYLGGLIHCKHCGGKYCKNDWKQRNGSTTKIYSCYSRSKKVKKMIKDPNCKNKNWKRDELDGIILDEIKKLAIDPDYMSVLKESIVEVSEEPNKVAIIKAEITSLEEQISRFMDLYGIGKFTIEQVSGKVDPLNEQKTALERELAKFNAERGAITVEEALEAVKSFEEALSSGDFEKTRAIIEYLIYYIEIDNDTLYIHWKFNN